MYILQYYQRLMKKQKSLSVGRNGIKAGNPSRRQFFAGAGAVVAGSVVMMSSLVQEVLAQEADLKKTSSKLNIPYRQSKLGINYYDLAESPLAEMLSQGEAEWMKNAKGAFGDDVVEAWIELVPEVSSGIVSKLIIESMSEFTPEMLKSFASLERGSQYSLLSAAGSAAIAKGFADKLTEEPF